MYVSISSVLAKILQGTVQKQNRIKEEKTNEAKQVAYKTELWGISSAVIAGAQLIG